MVRVKTPIHLFTYSPIHLFSTPHTKIPSTRAQYYCTLEAVWCMPTTLSKSLPFCCLEIKSKTKNIFLLRVKTPIHLFTYSPIHFFARLSGNKKKTENILLLRIKTTIHLFTYSLSGNKIKKWTTFSCSELKQLFTYSPIHLFAYFRGVLGVLNQKGTDACMAARFGRMRLKMRLASSLIQFYLSLIAICVPHKNRTPPLLRNKQCRNSVGAPRCSEPIASG